MTVRFLRPFADNRHIQSPANHFRNFPESDSLFGDRVISARRYAFLQHAPVETSGIQPVHCRPTVQALSDICGNTLFACEADEKRDESMIAVPMDRRWKPNHR